MSTAKRRKIRQLRALAASTTFPAEAASARAKADAMEATLPKVEPSEHVFDPASYLGAGFHSFAMDRFVREVMQQMMDDMMKGGL